MQNNRQYKRYAVKCSGYIIDSAFEKHRFHVNNMSACGMNITTDEELNETYMLTIRFDITGTMLPHAKLLKGIIMREKINPSHFNYSIRFIDLTHTEIIEIDEYLRYKLNNYVIPLEEPEKALIE